MLQASSPLLSALNLKFRRGGRELYGGRSFAVENGQLIWLRGENGAGKTSLLRILAGLLRPDDALMRWKGGDYEARLDEAGSAIALLDERLGLCRDLSVRDNLNYFAAMGGQMAAVPQLIEKFQLEALWPRLQGELSTGQRKRVGLARLALSGAQLWLLDEPANGLDQANRQRLANCLQAHVAGGGAAVVASHDALDWGSAPLTEWCLN